MRANIVWDGPGWYAAPQDALFGDTPPTYLRVATRAGESEYLAASAAADSQGLWTPNWVASEEKIDHWVTLWTKAWSSR